MSQPSDWEYGACPCGGKYEPRFVEVRMTTRAVGLIVLTEVPQGACSSCGSRVYKAEILQRIEALMRR